MIEAYKAEPATLFAELLRENGDESCARIYLDGVNDKIINDGSKTSYEVESGRGAMIANGIYYDLEPGTKICIPKGVTYQDAGRKLVMYAVSTPPFDPARVRKV